jgi:uncharacterized protein YndB with AHSA1/START domain
MTTAKGDQFVYVTFVRTTPERLLSALTDPEFQKQYWHGMSQESEWKPGSPWRMAFEDGRTADAGRVLEADPPRRAVIEWRNEFREELKAEGVSTCTYELEPAGEAVKLTVTHAIGRENSQLIQAVSGGWPQILSNLKTLLETGEPLMIQRPAVKAA